MTVTTIALIAALASSVSWAGFDAARKFLSTHCGTIPLVTWLMIGQLPVFVVWWSLTGFASVGAEYWLPGGVGLLLNIAANLLFVQSVKIGELSTTVPLLALTPALTLIVASLLLAELPAPVDIAAIVAIVLGAFALNMPAGFRLRAWWTEVRSNPGALLMAIVAVLWSATAALDKYALAHAPVPFHAGVQSAGIAVTLIAFLAITGQIHQLRELRKRRGQYLAAVALSVTAMGLQLVAIQLMYVAIMEAMKRAIGMAGAMLNGRILFGEQITKQKLAAVSVMTLGVIVLMR